MTLIRATLYEAAVERGAAYAVLSFRTLGNNQIKTFSITAPTSPPETIGLAFDIDPEGQVLAELFRETVLNATPAGTLLTLINQNEASSNVADTLVREDPVIDAIGVGIGEVLLGTGRQGNTVGGSASRTNVLTLAKNQATTVVRLTSGATSNVINFSIRVIED